MSPVEKIEREVQKLSPEDLREFRSWFVEFDGELWDRQFERDVAAGNLDALGDEALADLDEGRTRSL